jgi:hypothetical protein
MIHYLIQYIDVRKLCESLESFYLCIKMFEKNYFLTLLKFQILNLVRHAP